MEGKVAISMANRQAVKMCTVNKSNLHNGLWFPVMVESCLYFSMDQVKNIYGETRILEKEENEQPFSRKPF